MKYRRKNAQASRSLSGVHQASPDLYVAISRFRMPYSVEFLDAGRTFDSFGFAPCTVYKLDSRLTGMFAGSERDKK